MDITEYLENHDIDPKAAIHLQVIQLKGKLEDHENFKSRDEWKHGSYVVEGDDEDNAL